LSLPSFSIRFCSTAWKPGFSGIVPSGIFQISSACLRCSGLVTTVSAGRRCEKVPTSRAVPQAEGWPVSENGELPGSAIFPVRRWML
jgi:hypothetical protein